MITDADRRAQLNQAVSWEVGMGGRVVQYTPTEVVIARPAAPVNHVVHCLLTLFTFGLWGIVWFLAAVTRPGPQYVGLSVDEFGFVRNRPLQRSKQQLVRS